MDTTQQDSVTPGELQWRPYYQTVSIPYTDILLNQGDDSVVDFITSKEEIAMGSLLQKLSRALWATAPNNTAIDLDPITTALGAAGGTYAGNVVGGANPWWLCNRGLGPDTGAVATLARYQAVSGQATNGNEEADTMALRQQGWDDLWGLMAVNQRFSEDAETTRAGFRHLMFNSAVVLRDGYVPANNCVFLNSKYVFPFFAPVMNN